MAADLDYRVCGKLAAVVNMQVRLIKGFDGYGLGVLPSHHLEHHLMPAHMRQLLHRVGGLYPDLQPFPPSQEIEAMDLLGLIPKRWAWCRLAGA